MSALREALRTAVERRTFITISGAFLTALAATWATAPTAALTQTRDGEPVGEEFIALMESTTHGLASLPTHERQHTPTLLDACLATVTDRLTHGRYTPTVGLRLHTLAASLFQTIAWHRFDRGRHSHASQYWIGGLHNAHTAGDHDMGAGLLGDLAYQAAWRGDHTTAASILNHALSRAHNPAARCLLQLRLARTLAAQGGIGEPRAVLRALSAAERHLSDAGDDRPTWCAWVSEADLAVDSGQALLDLGDTGRAHQLIAEGECLLPTTRDKTRGVFLAYRAASYLDSRNPSPPQLPPPNPCSWPAVSAHPAASPSSTTSSPASSLTAALRASRNSANSPPHGGHRWRPECRVGIRSLSATAHTTVSSRPEAFPRCFLRGLPQRHGNGSLLQGHIADAHGLLP
ncbi:hypothetical protein ACFYO5_35955 [Streptomyces sp. NPDC006259]|uniref:hypothetical protein n=1 Tax=Streptomyces sp. NPDC006259 TaxID=3364740 RepID=UPI003683FAF1